MSEEMHAFRNEMYGLISARIISGDPGDWMRFEDEMNAAFDRTKAVAVPLHLRGDGPCDKCGTVENIVWFTENVLWNRVTREGLTHEERSASILCIYCFVTMADAVGLRPTGWRLLAEWPWREAPVLEPQP